MLSADLAATAHRAGEAVRPTRREQIRATRLLVWKQALELDHRARKLSAIRAPCVLASHSSIAPRQRVVIPLELLRPSR
jgi:hypothetical protein